MTEFKTEQELLTFFENGGCLLDFANRDVYISDIDGDGEFYGIMVAGPVPHEFTRTVCDAVEYALAYFPAPGAGTSNRMSFMEAPGWWFGLLADAVIKNPQRFEVEE